MRLKALFVTVLLAAASGARADFTDLYADSTDVPVNKAPRSGHSSVVLIPVQIDFGQYQPVDMAALHQFFEGAYASDLTFKHYYETISNGRYHPDVTVAPLVEYQGCPSMIHTSDCTIERATSPAALSHGMDFVRDVFRRAHTEGKVDFSKFDVNGVQGAADGTIDGAMIVVNIPNAGVTFPIEYVNNGSNLAGGTGNALILDGVRIPYVALGGATFADNQQHLEYVILHEFAHLLGFADLFYEHPAANDQYPLWQGLHYSLMGDYDYSPQVAMPDAESRRALGWQPHVVVSGTQTITLAPAAAGGVAVKLGMMNNARKEYFIAEARGPAAGLDTGIKDASGNPTWGLALYHVDWSKGPKAATGEWPGRMLFCLDCNPFHPFIGNVESSGGFLLVNQGVKSGPRAGAGQGVPDDMILFHGGSITSLDNAQPLSPSNRYVATNFYDGTSSGVSIRDIQVNADHSVTATFTAPAVDDACADVTCGAMEQCVQSGALAGNCQPFEESIPDAGVLVGPSPAAGCSTSGTQGIAGSALLLGLGLALLFRRRTA